MDRRHVAHRLRTPPFPRKFQRISRSRCQILRAKSPRQRYNAASVALKSMLKTLALLLPALIPSWRFFDEIAPSPRIEFALLRNADESPSNWQEFRPRPARLTFGDRLKRMFWNARWNESLFLVSCAERLMQNPTAHSEQEIQSRIAAELMPEQREATPYLQFRLVFISRHRDALEKHITFVSPSYFYGGAA